MNKDAKKRKKVPASACKREHRMVCWVSEDEQRIVDRYLAKYHISNKGRWMRETLLAFVYKTMENDYPTLFNEHDMRR